MEERERIWERGRRRIDDRRKLVRGRGIGGGGKVKGEGVATQHGGRGHSRVHKSLQVFLVPRVLGGWGVGWGWRGAGCHVLP